MKSGQCVIIVIIIKIHVTFVCNNSKFWDNIILMG